MRARDRTAAAAALLLALLPAVAMAQTQAPAPAPAPAPAAAPAPAIAPALRASSPDAARHAFNGALVTTPLAGAGPAGVGHAGAGPAGPVVPATVSWIDSGSALDTLLRVSGEGDMRLADAKEISLDRLPAGRYHVDLILQARVGECRGASSLTGRVVMRGTRIEDPVEIAITGVGLLCPGDAPFVQPVGDVTLK